MTLPSTALAMAGIDTGDAVPDVDSPKNFLDGLASPSVGERSLDTASLGKAREGALDGSSGTHDTVREVRQDVPICNLDESCADDAVLGDGSPGKAVVGERVRDSSTLPSSHRHRQTPSPGAGGGSPTLSGGSNSSSPFRGRRFSVRKGRVRGLGVEVYELQVEC